MKLTKVFSFPAKAVVGLLYALLFTLVFTCVLCWRLLARVVAFVANKVGFRVHAGGTNPQDVKQTSVALLAGGWFVLKWAYITVSYLVLAAFALLGLGLVVLGLQVRESSSSLLAPSERPLGKTDQYLYIDTYSISQRSVQSPAYVDLARNLGFNVPNVVSLDAFRDALSEAAKDTRIKGLIFDWRRSQFSFATGHQLNLEIRKFKEASHKPVYGLVWGADSELLALQSADRIYLLQTGGIDLTPNEHRSLFMGDFYKNYGIKDYTQVAGKYNLDQLGFFANAKAVPQELKQELDVMTKQVDDLVISEYNQARQLNLTPKDFSYETTLQNYRNFIGDTQAARSLGLVDKVVSYFGWEDEVRKIAGVDKNKRPNVVSLGAYISDMYYREAPHLDEDADYYEHYYYQGTLGGNLSADTIVNDLYRATVYAKPKKDEPKLKGIVLRLNITGGSVSQAQEVADAIKKASQKVPVVVYVNDLLFGAGLGAAAAADGLVVNPYALVGSLTAISPMLDTTDTLRAFYAINPSYFKSSNYQAADGSLPYPFNEFLDDSLLLSTVSPEYVSIRKQRVEVAHNALVKLVKNGRGFSDATKAKVDQGQVFLGEQATKVHLADAVGGLDDAFAYLDYLNLQRDPKFDKSKIVKYEANPASGPYSSLLATVSYELNRFIDYQAAQKGGALYTTVAQLNQLASFGHERTWFEKALGLNKVDPSKVETFTGCLTCSQISTPSLSLGLKGSEFVLFYPELTH